MSFIMKALVTIVTSVFLYVLSIYMIYTDISLEPVPKKFCTSDPRAPVYLVTYADGAEVFYQNQNFIVFSDLNKGIDHFLSYRRHLIDPTFISKNQEV